MDYPVAPHNVNVLSPYSRNAVDIRWDDPSILSDNSAFRILGVNVYRSYDSEFGPYSRINSIPLGSQFYRDQATLDVVVNEDVSGRFISRGTEEGGKWFFKTSRYPIMKQATDTAFVYATSGKDIELKIDGVLVPAFKVRGEEGIVELISSQIIDPVTDRLIDPVLPGPNSLVQCTYRVQSNLVNTSMDQRLWYRLTTVAEGSETPVDSVQAVGREIEKIDWVWREAIRRNRWILQQGGERVKVFLMRQLGTRCSCWVPTKNQAINDCPLCFGSGIVGGYDGPYDMIVSPDDTQRKKQRSNIGTSLEHSWEIWTGPSPLLSHRDFVVRQNGDRYVAGAPSFPSARGAILQQHLTMSYIDSHDIRYKVPVTGTESLVFPQTRLMPPGSNVYPEITDKSEIPEERQLRGRTVVWENITY